MQQEWDKFRNLVADGFLHVVCTTPADDRRCTGFPNQAARVYIQFFSDILADVGGWSATDITKSQAGVWHGLVLSPVLATPVLLENGGVVVR